MTTEAPTLAPLLDRVVAGERLGDADAERLLATHDLPALARAAHALRMRLHPEPCVTFNIDRNLNTTNVCVGGCRFCAFHRPVGHAEGYVLDHAAMREKIEALYAVGGRQILLQGGLNPQMTLAWHEDLLRWLKGTFTDLHIHGFSPPEILFFARQADTTPERVIERLRAAGLDSIPGGGAEILSDRVRNALSPGKASADEWIAIMRTAHRLGLRTTATMMYGWIETPAERVEHLRRLRELQDETGGFTAFAAWNYQPPDTAFKERHAGAFEHLKVVAVARLYLDNFDNIQTSWVTQGGAIAQMCLLAGANDLGGLMLEERVVAAAGTRHTCTREELERWTHELGFELRRRDFYYRPVAHTQ